MRLIIVSNRAPVNIIKTDEGYRYEDSSGGLATGLRAYVERMKKKNPDMEIIWIGWPGAAVDDEQKAGREIFEKFGTRCVFLSEEMMEEFYEGFCNKTIWPLFHYFPVYTVYQENYWQQYKTVNEIFRDAVLDEVREGDLIWVHDYHLMLLPGMLRKKLPEATIGFFLHIPFPSYEIFRMLPRTWRHSILDGIYGADLIGFHTYDYCTYFLRSTLRILGLADNMGEVVYRKRNVRIESFPMSIDYAKFNRASKSKTTEKEVRKLRKRMRATHIILSIDRQDYSKGVLNRLNGYAHFLETNPDWKNKVTMVMIVIPSRIGVESYQSIKSNIDELVGSINGKYGTLEWMPIIYRYSSIPFHELIALYTTSDVALVTPLRDGMNLVAKEYIACRTGNRGVLILSEMAGAAAELIEAIIVNPNNREEISGAILEALQMDGEEQAWRFTEMQNRIKNYNVVTWADDFITSIHAAKQTQEKMSARNVNRSAKQSLLEEFIAAKTRTLFLDYDGTLVPYAPTPEKAQPTNSVLSMLEDIAGIPSTRVVLISGRDRLTLEKWFGHLPVSLVAEHGLFIKDSGKSWKMIKPIRKVWKKKIIPILEHYTARLYGSFIEEKEYTLVFHFRKCDPSLASMRVKELLNHLLTFTANMDVQVIRGNKIIEVSNAGIDKGLAAMQWLSDVKNPDEFILAAGDDYTDENLFRTIPATSWSIKVGDGPSHASYNIADPEQMTDLLQSMIEHYHKKSLINSER